MKIGILESSDFSKKSLNQLNKLGNVYLYNNHQDLKIFISDKDILFVRLNYSLNLDLLKYANKLKYICSPTTGLNHIDNLYCKKKKIQIISLKGEIEFLSDIRATSEHTLGLILSLLRNYKQSFYSIKSTFNRDIYKGHEIYGSKIGIIGYGRIGKLLSKYIISLGGSCYFYDIDSKIVPNEFAEKLSSIEELVKKVDIIVLSASYSIKNTNIINKDIIDLMEDKYFINTSRGELIDEKYLINKILMSHFKGVALDVISNETNNNNNLKLFKKLSDINNFIITPHIGGATYTSMKRTEDFITNKLINIIDED